MENLNAALFVESIRAARHLVSLSSLDKLNSRVSSSRGASTSSPAGPSAWRRGPDARLPESRAPNLADPGRKRRSKIQLSRAQPTSPRSAPSECPSAAPSPRKLLLPVSVRFEATLQQSEAPGSDVWKLSPLWRLVLLSDGSVTRHLKLLTGAEPVVECIDMKVIDNPYGSGGNGGASFPRNSESQNATCHIPPEVSRISGDLLQRQVFIKDAKTGVPLVYAASWWNKEEADRYLKDRNKSMWRSLQEGHLELFRDIGRVVHGDSAQLEVEFGQQGPFWGRFYTFWADGRPLTVIYEAFNSAIEEYYL